MSFSFLSKNTKIFFLYFLSKLYTLSTKKKSSEKREDEDSGKKARGQRGRGRGNIWEERKEGGMEEKSTQTLRLLPRESEGSPGLLSGSDTYSTQFLKSNCRYFSGGPVVKNLPASAGDGGSIPGPGRSRVLWGSWARVPQLLSPQSRTREPQPEKAHTKTQHSQNQEWFTGSFQVGEKWSSLVIKTWLCLPSIVTGLF